MFNCLKLNRNFKIKIINIKIPNVLNIAAPFLSFSSNVGFICFYKSCIKSSFDFNEFFFSDLCISICFYGYLFYMLIFYESEF